MELTEHGAAVQQEKQIALTDGRRLQLRRMQKQDAATAAALEAGCLTEAWSEKSYQDALTNPAAFYVAAELEGKMAGCCGYWQSFEEADICNVAVARDCRRLGIAEQMLVFLMEHAQSRGVSAFTLEVRDSNAAAVLLYEKLGFVTEGIRKNFYDNPKEDARIMWKR